MAHRDMTQLDRTKIQGLNIAVRELNDQLEVAVGQGYEIRIRVEEGKSGIPRVRFTLHRQVGLGS